MCVLTIVELHDLTSNTNITPPQSTRLLGSKNHRASRHSKTALLFLKSSHSRQCRTKLILIDSKDRWRTDQKQVFRVRTPFSWIKNSPSKSESPTSANSLSENEARLAAEPGTPCKCPKWAAPSGRLNTDNLSDGSQLTEQPKSSETMPAEMGSVRTKSIFAFVKDTAWSLP